jgi:signal peptidase I
VNPALKAFLFPKPTPAFFVRAASVALGAFLFFQFILTPFVVRGASMEPAYHDGTLHFVLKTRYWFGAPEPGDVVAVRLAGERVFYLKRVVAVAGQRVAFADGVLQVDGRPVDEPYVLGPCDWNLEPRDVQPGNVYLVGDNRSMPMEAHDFGQAPVRRVVGAPLW